MVSPKLIWVPWNSSFLRHFTRLEYHETYLGESQSNKLSLNPSYLYYLAHIEIYEQSWPHQLAEYVKSELLHTPTKRSLPPPIKPPSFLSVKGHFFGSCILFAIPNTDASKKRNKWGQISSSTCRKTPLAAEQGELRTLRVWVNRPWSSWNLKTDKSSLLLDLTFIYILHSTP